LSPVPARSQLLYILAEKFITFIKFITFATFAIFAIFAIFAMFAIFKPDTPFELFVTVIRHLRPERRLSSRNRRVLPVRVADSRPPCGRSHSRTSTGVDYSGCKRVATTSRSFAVNRSRAADCAAVRSEPGKARFTRSSGSVSRSYISHWSGSMPSPS
jgi:hypothetical protein